MLGLGGLDFSALAKSGDALAEKFDMLVSLLRELNTQQTRTNELLEKLAEEKTDG